MLKIESYETPLKNPILSISTSFKKGEVRDEDQAIAGQSDC